MMMSYMHLYISETFICLYVSAFCYRNSNLLGPRLLVYWPCNTYVWPITGPHGSLVATSCFNATTLNSKTLDHQNLTLHSKCNTVLLLWGQLWPGEYTNVLLLRGKPWPEMYHITKLSWYTSHPNCGQSDMISLSDWIGFISCHTLPLPQ